MTIKLTFKEYLDSKEKLREAVSKTPQRTATYNVRKYCKLIVGESKDSKDQVALKPTHRIVVDWLYEDIDNPTIVSITFEGVKEILPDDEFNTYWDGVKLMKWLNRNTTEEQIP
jgi:hypothetical protein